MELYYVIAITDRDRSDNMLAVYRNVGLQTINTMLGRGTATDYHLAMDGLDAKEKAIVSAVASADEAVQLTKLAKRKLMLDIPGNGIMITIPLKSVGGGKTLAYLTNCKEIGGKPSMDFEYELIIAILNEGYADYVMEAARSAGAGGGTVLHAKGTGGIRAEKFFGVSLADEKDMVYIVARSDEKTRIMKSIQENAGPGTKAGAICFSLPITSVVGLRAREE